MPEAITPYNFVPLPDRIVGGEEPPTADRYHADRYTGWFEVSYTTVTPTYTRAALGVSANYAKPVAMVANQSADFFHYGDQIPVLPGSSLRGMIRSVFEILTYSKMQFVSERRLFYRTFASGQKILRELYAGEQDQNRRTIRQGKFRKELLVGGVLRERNGELFLEVSSAVPKGFVVVDKTDDIQRRFDNNNRYQVHTVKFEEKEEKHYALDVLQARLTDGGVSGRLIIPGWEVPRGERRWYQVIAEPQAGASTEYRVPEDVYDDYLAWGDMAHGQKFSRTGGRREAPRKLVAGQYAFALLNDSNEQEVAVIGANMMMAIRYDSSIKSVAQKGIDPLELDMTDSVFGYVRESKVKEKQIHASRVFFEDARCQTASPWLDTEKKGSVKVPSILSGPKPTSIQTYLVQFDREGNEFPPLRGGGRTDLRDLRHWSHADATIRGFKRYWHRSLEAALGELQPNILDDEKLGTQCTRIRPVREDTAFTGRVRFENLTAAELGAIYASIQLPNKPYDFLHKFGMGKNLGLGSLRVDVTDTVLLDAASRYGTFCAKTEGIAGQKSPEDTEATLKLAYAAFVAKLPGRADALWSRERLQELAILSITSWLNDATTRQMGVNGDEGRQWKQRYLLSEARFYIDAELGIPEDVIALPKQERPTKPSVSSKPETPAPAVERSYRTGSDVQVKVLDDPGVPPTSSVEIQDGSGLVILKKNVQLKMGVKLGGIVKMKVVDVDAKGKILKLKQ